MEKYTHLELTIQYVFKANFNDSYYLETVCIELKDLEKDDLVWIDPFCGRSKINNTSIAVKSYSDKEYIIFKKQGDKIQEFKHPINFTLICSEDFNDSLLLASHITFRK